MSKMNVLEIFDQGPSDKDGDGDDPTGLTDVEIKIALNGYCVTFYYDSGAQERFIDDDFDEVLKLIRSKH